MSTLYFSKEEGFGALEDSYVPNLEKGCVVECKSQSDPSESWKIRFKLYRGGRETGKVPGVFEVSFDDVNDPDKVVGWILFTINNGAINIRNKKIEIKRYENQGLMTAATSLLADYARKKFRVDRIEGTIVDDNITSIRSRLSIRDIHTNGEFETYKTRHSEPKIITYLSSGGATLSEKSDKDRLLR